MPHKEAWPEYINLQHRQHKGNSIAKREMERGRGEGGTDSACNNKCPMMISMKAAGSQAARQAASEQDKAKGAESVCFEGLRLICNLLHAVARSKERRSSSALPDL